MGLTAAILGALGAIAAVLGVLDILEVTSEPLISDKLNWMFWMYAAIILILGAIAFLLGRKQNYEE
jgi:membrane associated rhomboid family serine protease